MTDTERMAESTDDYPGVIAPPPLIVAAALVAGLLLDWLVPAYVLSVLLSLATRLFFGGLLTVGGLGLIWLAGHQFHRLGTNALPWQPSLVLATGEIYGHLRNPMYVGMIMIAVGVAIALASDWTLVLLVPAAFALHRGVVLREERYLTAKFGEDYRQYLAKVPRYGWPG
jgi:protein-S-isoprenylcysteine O-methyltransferase Ste14